MKNVPLEINMTIPFSCRDRCFKTYKRSPMLECMCDHACMFLGDCCHDYLLECDPRKLDDSAALREQLSVFRRYHRHSSCITEALSGIEALKMVNTCPQTVHSDNEIGSMCSNHSDKRTMSSCVPVESDGILYRNIYCAACHGRPLHQVHTVASFECPSHSISDSHYHLLPFADKIDCGTCNITVKPQFKRYGDACWCRQALPDRSCVIPLHEDECNAYTEVVYDRRRRPYNNKACKSCDSDGKANVARPHHCPCGPRSREPIHTYVKLFDFTTESFQPAHTCTDYHTEGQSDNPCLAKHCQAGFQLHDDKCMSILTAQLCYPPGQNRYNSDFLIANLFRAAIIIHYKADSVTERLFSNPDHIHVQQGAPCKDLPLVYNSLQPQTSTNAIQCVLLHFDSFTFATLTRDLSMRDISKELFPHLDVVHMMLLNHEPLSGISCSGGARLVRMTHLHVLKGGIIRCRSKEFKQIFMSNKDPMAMIYTQFMTEMEMWVLICKPNIEEKNCTSQLMTENLSPMNTCVKYGLTDNNTMENGVIVLNSGKTLKDGEFMRTEYGTILVCAEFYDKLHQIFSYTWSAIVSVSYTISLVCLMATFVIYIRYRELRTLPGLMLMNLIVTLFIAQLLFLLNSWSLFETNPVLCLIMATLQHYFWLASFVWMGCLSQDIFRCFSSACTTVSTYSASKYTKYMLAGWLMPLPFPLTASVLTLTTSSTLAYSTSGPCWMADPQGVLYLFAIPVFIIVASNIMLFIGSVNRLCTLMKNAAYVGRKEDNKLRLIQCIKLSSWMGVSWLFGIIPNIVGIDALWYVFVTTNALQGLHIFFAFGVTGRARVLIKENDDVNMVSATASSTVHSAKVTDRQKVPQKTDYEVKDEL